MSNTNEQASRHLGKNSSYKSGYDPTLLVAIDRQENRENYGIVPDEFVGFDIWNCYEVSFLLMNNLPIVGKLKIVYPSSSKYIVESKSLKLYLNSLNNTQLYNIQAIETCVSTDLSALLGVFVKVKFMRERGDKEIYTEFTPGFKLENRVKTDSIQFDVTTGENPEVLGEFVVPSEEPVYNLFWSELLRSNCRVTGQPDWGDVYIKIQSKYEISEESLLKYLISFRNENHFHEEVCEMIYHRLLTFFKPSLLMVGCVYTRRGGIDIVPIRANKEELLDINLIEYSSNNLKLFRQ